MVVLLASVLTKQGKVLVSRQYVNMDRMRVEGILAVFPKLLGEANKQHTFVEANNLRYVYQPIENLVVLVVTTKNSNIVEDLETLHTLAKIVPEYAGSIQEEAVVDHAFDIIFALDELITYGGMNEDIPLQQVRVNLAMESHEEKLLAMVQESKMNQAKEIMKQKEKELKAQQPAQSGFSFFSSLLSSVVSGVASTVQKPAAPQTPSYSTPSTTSTYNDIPSSREVSSSLGQGMKLTASKKDTLSNLMKEDHLVTGPSKKTEQAAPQRNVTAEIEIMEEGTARVTRDGLIEEVTLKGNLCIKINNPEATRCRVHLTHFDPLKRFQSQLHPSMARSFFDDSIIMMKDPAREMPVDSLMNLTRWRLVNANEDFLPLTVTCWPEPMDGGFDVNLEYNLNPKGLPSVENLCVCIPLPKGNVPEIVAVDGAYHYFPKESYIQWTVDEITQDKPTGILEFKIKGDNEDDFFPASVEYESDHTYMDTDVEKVTLISNDTPVTFSQTKKLRLKDYVLI